MYVGRPEPSPICGVYEGAGLRQRLGESYEGFWCVLAPKKQRPHCGVPSKRPNGQLGGGLPFVAYLMNYEA